jgi:hypothetical protein
MLSSIGESRNYRGVYYPSAVANTAKDEKVKIFIFFIAYVTFRRSNCHENCSWHLCSVCVASQLMLLLWLAFLLLRAVILSSLLLLAAGFTSVACVPAHAGSLAVAGVPLFSDVLTVAGLPAIASVPGLGVPAIVFVPCCYWRSRCCWRSC